MKNLCDHIMMGGTKNRHAAPAVSQKEEHKRNDAGFTNPDKTKKSVLSS